MPIVRAAIVLTMIVMIAAVFVLASEIVLILFLGVLFGVFLFKLSLHLHQLSSIGYGTSLASVVSILLIVFAGATSFFFVQINQQIERASEKMDEGIGELRDLVQQYPALRSSIASTPILSDALIASNDRRPDSVTGDNSGEQSVDLTNVPEPVERAASTIGKLFRTTFGLVVNSLLIFFVGLFLAVSPKTYRDGIVKLVPIAKRDRATEVLGEVIDTLWRWLIGRFGSMLVTGVGAFIVLWIIGVPLAGTLSVMTALLTFVPNIGAGVALLLAVLFALPQGVGAVGAVVIAYIALQLVESYVVTPLIQQRQVSLPPALLISFQAIMGVLFGFIGAAVASPLLAGGKTAVEMLYVQDYLRDKP